MISLTLFNLATGSFGRPGLWYSAGARPLFLTARVAGQWDMEAIRVIQLAFVVLAQTVRICRFSVHVSTATDCHKCFLEWIGDV
ncbi:hypothetical protein E6O75_ATG02460 [Venturia nashicola]|uniref:Uncharacterized protein n=1 Tax=Venturia nashicola TaxID=86259 RepID=A0A4Z1P729_9PEZI|nr:hypothetical protein E6O75_ATG02460 [Venturia nashicola]